MTAGALALVLSAVFMTPAGAADIVRAEIPQGPQIAGLDCSTHPVDGSWCADDSPVLVWSPTDVADVAGYSYVLDRVADAIPDETSEGIATSASYAGLGDGVWYFHVRAVDALGIWGPAVTRAVRIDTTPPSTTVNAPSGWHNHPVRVILKADDAASGVAFTQYSRDGGTTWANGASVTIAAPADHSGDGVHAVLYCSTDRAGNRESAKTARVRIDTRPPRFSWRSVSPRLLHRTQPVQLGFSVADLSGRIRVSYRVVDAWDRFAARRGGFAFAPGLCSLAVRTTYADGRAFLPGLYRVSLRLVDAAGNARRTSAVVFRDHRPARAHVWFSVSGAGRRVALTFDDGYDRSAWASILSTLRACGVRATFFVNGCHVVQYPDLARRTVAQGNAVGSHTWSHTATTGLTEAQIQGELQRDVAVWWQVARVTPVPYFRPPGGLYDGETLAVAGAAGFARVVLWCVDPVDWSGPSAATITQRVLSHVYPGAIVALHCMPQTAVALPAIISGLRGQGYSIVTLPALFRAGGYR